MDRLSPNIPEAIRHNLMSTPPGFLIPKVTNLPVPKTEKATLISERGLYLCRQLPTLPHTFACSTIGPAGLNFRVRDGNGWNPRGKITDNLMQLRASSCELRACLCGPGTDAPRQQRRAANFQRA